MGLTNQDINSKLESLVGGRYYAKELNKKLSQLFGCNVEVAEYEREECVKKELPFLDNQLLFVINCNVRIDVDLFYLLDNGGKYYITETCFN